MSNSSATPLTVRLRVAANMHPPCNTRITRSPPTTSASRSASRRACRSPTRKPTAPDAVDLVLVHLETDAGVTGSGFTYALGPGAAAVRSLIDTELSPLVVGEDPRDTERLFARAEARFRGVGFAGLAARAYCAIDVALWDVKAKAAGVPLCEVARRREAGGPFFVSDAATLGRDAGEARQGREAAAEAGRGRGARRGRRRATCRPTRTRARDSGRARRRRVGRGRGGRAVRPRAPRWRWRTSSRTSASTCSKTRSPRPTRSATRSSRELMEVPLAVGAQFDSRDAFFRVIRAGDGSHRPPGRVPPRRHHAAVEGGGGGGGVSRRGVAGADAGGRRASRVRAGVGAARRFGVVVPDVFAGGADDRGRQDGAAAGAGPGTEVNEEAGPSGECVATTPTRCNGSCLSGVSRTAPHSPQEVSPCEQPREARSGTAPHPAAGTEAGRGVQDGGQVRQPAVRLRPRPAQGRQDHDHRPASART